ncbi:Putative tyrosinase copper-binding domain, di-copper centre-containing domain superfamily, tyosinase [Septoria linicola]|uniref:tyrosinase n=1 Tax=Septoria linicola TaxID=215465 RepID=A0A9Q9AK53_9PEZI|nr:putative tyrosinase copper-binding domain, di-copper centre-containing domain superfamily, tyosinase [Septoria linicola]USW50510.1 Putative tyrosinase copper-binding domain, di-copper centre-containing domain superfamily, tyosinase [Septoria linicola]
MKFLLATTLLTSLTAAYVPVPRADVNAQNGRPATRKDITTMGAEEYSLFILAMQQWQRSPTSDIGGYYQVAGIHGAPHQYWDNGGGYQNTGQGNKGGGYCFHGTKDFYLWHRPYLALYEQQIRAVAINIANSWTSSTRATYQAAANNLRFPYWDWARNGGSIPSQLTNSQVTITNAAGNSVTINNPLFSHTLVSGANLGTSVCPGGSSSRTCRSSSAQRDMQSSGSGLTRNVALLLNTRNICWNNFATYDSNERRASGCSSSSVQSLEAIHNTVHNNICGTMCNLDTAAFDPIFWLHHANVDRIGALWNYLNPNIRVTATTSSSGNYVFSSGRSRDASFTYMPFRGSNSNTDWWQPGQLYDVRSSGYTYPEIADLPSVSTLQTRVNNLYGNGRTQQAVSVSKSKRGDEISQLLVSRQSNGALTAPPSPEALAPFRSALITRNGSYSEYTAECTIRRSVAPGTSFNLHLFFGDVVQGLSNSDYLSSPNRVGGFSISQAASTNGANDATGVVPITDALLNTLIAGGIRDLKPNTVRKYVRAKLIWRIVTTDGQNVGGNGARNSGLQIRVRRSVVTPDGGANAPPVVEAPAEIAPPSDTDNTVAKPLESGVVGTSSAATAATTSATSTAAAEATSTA